MLNTLMDGKKRGLLKRSSPILTFLGPPFSMWSVQNCIKRQLGDTNKLYLTLHKVESLFLKDSKMRQMVRSFYRIKNKEQEREKYFYLIGWSHIVNLIRGEKEQGTEKRAQRWLGVCGLADWIDCISCPVGAFTGIQKLSKCPFADGIPWAGATPSWA